MSQGFNHFDENGNAVMVDVSGKNITYRTAVATGEIHATTPAASPTESVR